MKKNNFSIYRNNYFKKANNFLPNSYFNNSENDSSLQNRIERSLYPSNKRSQPYRTNTIHNISDYDYNNNSNNDLIEDFKTTLMKTQQLTNELRQNKTIYRNNNNYNFNKNNKFSFDFNNNFNNKNEKLSQKNFYVNNNNSYYDEFIVKESKIKTNKSYDENINIDNHHSQRKKYKMKKINKKNQYEVSSSNSEFEKENLIKYERKKNKNKRNNFDDKEIRINNQIDDNKHYKKIKRQNDYYTEDYIKNYRNDKNYIRSNLRYNNNLLHCVLMLLDELNEDELDIVRRKIQLKRNNNYY